MKYLLIIIGIVFCFYGLSTAEEDNVIDPQSSFFFASQDLNLYAQNDDLNDQSFSFDNASGKRKSTSKAILLSLALPGLGEMYAGRKNRAVGFFVAEAGIWASYIFFKHKQGWLEDDYINYAVQYADIDPEDKNEFFYDMLAFYDNRDEYNKTSRVYSRNHPFFPESPEWDWQWQSPDYRQEYRDIKNSSKSYARNANFALGAAFANRVISAIDAWWCVKSYNRQFSPLMSKIQVKLTPSFADIITGDESLGIVVNYRHSF